MKVRAAALLLTAVLLVACGPDEGSSDTLGMTAEEHARMQAGGTQGAMDSTGAAIRRPVHLTPAQEQALGVIYTTARRETLMRTIRTVGFVVAPEPDVSDVTLKISGFVERLYVNTTGETVGKGQPLLSLYSPMLVAAQEELLTAKRLVSQVDPTAGEAWASAGDMLEAARRRLRYWDITSEQIDRLESTGEVMKTLTLVAPASGIVLEKDVWEGQRVMPGMRLYRIADLSMVWVEGELFEQDLQFVREGSRSHIELAAYPGEHVMGTVSFVYPTVDVKSRTNRVRVSVPNPDLRLKPGMFATVFFDVQAIADGVTVPLEAVVVTGERNVVFLRDEEGMLVPREVVLGSRAGGRVHILQGVSEGETIVASANFLVDAESRLAGTGGEMVGMQHVGSGSAGDSEDRPSARDTSSGGARR
ncbi:MAG: efflux RND transporter periplasmic adaptor subunit [Gemmatimonadota bacterium]